MDVETSTRRRPLPTTRLTGDAWREWNAHVARQPVRRAKTPRPARLTHAELADAHERKDWLLLWQHALPIVQMIVSRMGRNGSVRSEDADDDLRQAGMEIAGLALRSWRPFECTFSTHVGNRVRLDLLNYATTRGSGGIGSYKQKPAVMSTGDERDACGAEQEGSPEDEEDDGNSFDAALTYEGVIRRYTGQYDGEGVAPEGFGDPEQEAQRAANTEAVRQAVLRLPSGQRSAVEAIFGLNGLPSTIREFAVYWCIPRSTASDLVQKALDLLGQTLTNFRHK